MHINNANVNAAKNTMILLLNIAVVFTLQRETFIRVQMKRDKDAVGRLC